MIQIINTGVANIRSLQAAFDRLQQPWHLTESAAEIEEATHVVLPGVGAYGAAAESLDRMGVREAIRNRLEHSQRATLCICLGMQLLGESSQESPEATGLAIVPRNIERFPARVAVPQLGWNEVVPTRADEHGRYVYLPGEAYFANSFRLVDPPPESWGYAITGYGGDFVSSLWHDRILACQFHPELSGAWGREVLANWIAGNEVAYEPDGESAC